MCFEHTTPISWRADGDLTLPEWLLQAHGAHCVGLSLVARTAGKDSRRGDGACVTVLA